MLRAQDRLADQSRSGDSCVVVNADLAFLLCLEVWGSPGTASPNHSPLRWLDSQWRGRLENTRRQLGPNAPAQALDQLRISHRFQCHADPGEVHPSWWVRALQEESPAVKQVIALHGPALVQAASHKGLAIERQAIVGPNADPAIIEWVLALATERLVGGEPIGYDEPPALVALAALSSRVLYRLVHATGQAKTVLAGDPQGQLAGRSLDDDRTRWFRDEFAVQLGPAEARARAWASRDLQQSRGPDGPRQRRRLASLGLSTIARLLAACEPYRVRWALQHVPYPIAKRIRSLMSVAPAAGDSVRHLESMILKTAWTRLLLEHRLAPGHPDQTMRPDHAP